MTSPELKQMQTEYTPERKSGGLHDWKAAIQKIGSRSVVDALRAIIPEQSPDGTNSHHLIAKRVEQLGLPSQTYTAPTMQDFLLDPDGSMPDDPDGQYYFVSVRQGVHLPRASREEAIGFIESYAAAYPEFNGELYISHCQEPLLGGHVMIERGEQPNVVYGEFTVGDFHSFHRGKQAPEIICRRDMQRFEWNFRGSLEPKPDTSWHSDETYPSATGEPLSRPEMATAIYNAISQIPHDDGYYLPGYYEVLLERRGTHGIKPVFIEATSAVV